MKLSKLLLATGVFFALSASAQNIQPQNAPTTPPGSTQPAGQGMHNHHHHGKFHKCVHEALEAKGLKWPGKDATAEQKQTFHEAKMAAKEQCKAEMQNTAPVKN